MQRRPVVRRLVDQWGRVGGEGGKRFFVCLGLGWREAKSQGGAKARGATLQRETRNRGEGWRVMPPCFVLSALHVYRSPRLNS